MTPAVQSSSLAARRAAASRYRPGTIRLLLVAEAPPCEVTRYFYFEDVDRHDWLFRYTYEGVTGKKPTRGAKTANLGELRDAGVFMIDLHEENVEQPSAGVLGPLVPGLVDRCRALRPTRIALVKSVVHDVAFEPLRAAGLPVIDERLPFPASGQQRKFLDGFLRVRAAAGL
ncbi:MAG TPA: hypothetical protein VEB22_00865 [Phycisphaerales bacterium]|nr:hypothetical protein [Phycisphaerales bacterium]